MPPPQPQTAAPPAPAIAPLAPALKPCARPFATPDVKLDGKSDFDRRLRRALSRHRRSVVVDLATPYPVDGTPPAAITPWTNQAKLSGGVARIETYCQDTRGLFGNFFKKLFSGGTSSPSYEAAFGYDVVLHVDGLTRQVTQVEFASRASK